MNTLNLYVITIIMSFALSSFGYAQAEGTFISLVAGQKVMTSDDKSNSDNLKLYEAKTINTKSADRIRLFVQVLGFSKNGPPSSIPDGSSVSVCIFHNHPSGSTQYSKTIAEAKSGSITAYLDVPVYGDTFRIVVWDEKLPASSYTLDVTAYYCGMGATVNGKKGVR